MKRTKAKEHQLTLDIESPNGAILSECRQYRYLLWRMWNPALPILTLCMLNPSTADESENDATITRCIKRAKLMQCGAIRVVNLFAFIDPDRGALRRVKDPIGPLNDTYIIEACRDAKTVLCGWGTDGSILGRGKAIVGHMVAAGIHPTALHINTDGSPKHPLYVSYAKKPQAFR